MPKVVSNRVINNLHALVFLNMDLNKWLIIFIINRSVGISKGGLRFALRRWRRVGIQECLFEKLEDEKREKEAANKIYGVLNFCFSVFFPELEVILYWE